MKVLWGIVSSDTDGNVFGPDTVTESKEHAERIRDAMDKTLEVQEVYFFYEGEMPDIKYLYSASLCTEDDGKVAPLSYSYDKEDGEVLQTFHYPMYIPDMAKAWNSRPEVKVQYGTFQRMQIGSDWKRAYDVCITGTNLDKVKEQLDKYNGMDNSELEKLYEESKSNGKV